MLIAAPVFFFLRKRPRLSLYFFALSLPAAVGWHVWGAVHAQATPYLDEYLRVIGAKGLGKHLLEQASTLSSAVAETFFSGILESLHGIPLHHLVLAAAIAGSVRIGRRRQWPLYLIFSALYLIMITFWWFQGIGRLIIPVWPMVLAGIVEEGSHFEWLCMESIKKPRFKMAPRWGLLALALYMVIWNDSVTWQKTAAIYRTEKEQRVRDRQAYAWIAAHAGPDTMVLAWKEGLSYLSTGVASSHDLFVAAIPQAEEVVGMRASRVAPAGFGSELLLLLGSDLGGSEGGMESLRARAEGLPGARLEFSAPGALVYRVR
jgi:hypothetical protein